MNATDWVRRFLPAGLTNAQVAAIAAAIRAGGRIPGITSEAKNAKGGE